MAKVRVVVDETALVEFIAQNKYIRDELVGTARSVAAEAQVTADSAQKGTGGDLTGYAEAGFTVVWQNRGSNKRPRVLIQSNADGKTATRVHFYTQKRDGVGHLRAALYKFTHRG